MSVQKSFQGQAIRHLQYIGEDCFPIINNLLYVTSMAMNVKNNLDNFQAMDIVNTIINDYADVKVDELIYIFKQGKKGIYGPCYNKFDLETIISWINGYYGSDEYNDFLENRHKQPVKDEPLTEAQRAQWQQTYKIIKDYIFQKEKEARIVRYENKPTVVNRVTNQVFAERLSNVLPVLEMHELEHYLAEYKKQNYDFGIELINKEIESRGRK